ncbi:hypothetical protein ACOME3_010337 [Neoechinorhynchus agilis]
MLTFFMLLLMVKLVWFNVQAVQPQRNNSEAGTVLKTPQATSKLKNLIFHHASFNSCYQSCIKDVAQNKNTYNKSTLKSRTSRGKVWVLGLTCTTAINIASLVGYLLKPCMKRREFDWILMVLIGVAIGSMAGSGILHLIPEGFGITNDGDRNYVLKAIVVMFGLYCFYLIDRILKILTTDQVRLQYSDRSAIEEHKHQMELVETAGAQSIDHMNPTHVIDSLSSDREKQFLSPITKIYDDKESTDEQNVQSLLDTRVVSKECSVFWSMRTIAPVAWMVLICDALHNFVDGLAIGAAFSDDVTKAISVCLAVAFEEIPNELGDFAVLLNSGLGLKPALFLNFVAACSNYIGLSVAIIIGELSQIHHWIYCTAGGMFLYISLVVMVNELNNMGDRLSSRTQKNLWPVFIVQNLGLICGFLIMLFFALYGDEIKNITVSAP